MSHMHSRLPHCPSLFHFVPPLPSLSPSLPRWFFPSYVMTDGGKLRPNQIINGERARRGVHRSGRRRGRSRLEEKGDGYHGNKRGRNCNLGLSLTRRVILSPICSFRVWFPRRPEQRQPGRLQHVVPPRRGGLLPVSRGFRPFRRRQEDMQRKWHLARAHPQLP